jgi:2-keto-4-pentenoate hydratase/2-oxohepta-3-ene-1,7-dioic acid hydratase in catechol pathway
MKLTTFTYHGTTCGTCSGVSVKITSCGYLKVGDRVRVEIDGIGFIENAVIEEPADTVRL